MQRIECSDLEYKKIFVICDDADSRTSEFLGRRDNGDYVLVKEEECHMGNACCVAREFYLLNQSEAELYFARKGKKMPSAGIGRGVLERRGEKLLFLYNGREYELGSQPYEPCLYIRQHGVILRTLHNAFTVDDLPGRFERGETLTGIDGKEYGREAFCRVLAAAIDSSRSEMDFPFAAGLLRKD